MASCGLDKRTGRVLTDWDHVSQSVDRIFETDIGERLRLRHFGGGVRRLLGRRITPGLLALASSVFALAVATWEPRLRVVKVSVAPSVDEIRAGVVSFVLLVAYRPRGHLGDFAEEASQFGVGIGFDASGALRTMGRS